MKRLIRSLFMLIIFTTVFFCSCNQSYDILSYQERDIISSCTVNEKYNIEISKKENTTTLTVLSPEKLCGTVFEIGENTSYVIKEEMKIPVKNQDICGIYALSNIFALKEGDIATVTENNVISFNDNSTVYTVTYGENNLPFHIDINGEGYRYSVDVNSIKFED